MTPLGEALASTHEMYTSLREAGFSKGEALELIARFMLLASQTEQEPSS